jgi:glycosyltransferase involved in cell wall biosynthesis
MLSWKRVDTLIRAFPLRQNQRLDATLTLVGYGPEQNRLEQLASKLLPAGRYHFVSPMPTSAILELMRHGLHPK